MAMFRTTLAAASAICAATASARAHNHMTVDTPSGTPGDQISIFAGYYGNETFYTIVDQRLLNNALPAIYYVPDQLAQAGTLNNWFAGDDLVLTSDYFFATGRLNGGDFQWEIASVVPIGLIPAIAAWGDFDGSDLVPQGMSNGATQPARSYDSGIASHDHAQAYAFSRRGVYDLKLVAWDGNGVYTSSAPVTVRFNVGNACPADFNQDGRLTVQDIFDFLSTWFSGSPSADFNGLGGVTVQDIFDFLSAWFSGCA